MKMDPRETVFTNPLYAGCPAPLFGLAEIRRAERFFQSVPLYRETGLLSLPALADSLGLRALHVKDENGRFGLPAFKALGGLYAMAGAVAERLGMDAEEMEYGELTRRCLPDLIFVTATDGNHGRGVAWAAKQWGFQAVVLMPKGTAEARVEAIRSEGARAIVTHMGYDDTVREAFRLSRARGWILLQDTSLPGYESVPLSIMQGYSVMAAEAVRQLPAPPTHCFLQAGVGAMAAGVMSALDAFCKEGSPDFTLVESCEAACFAESFRAGDGMPHRAAGSEQTVMAGLNCSEPCAVAWPYLSRRVGACAAISDEACLEAVHRYVHPLGDDPGIESGESGAASLGALLSARRDAKAWTALGLHQNASVLLINTEGVTNPGGL